MWHPNVYPSGLVCISILHPPEEDKYGYEDAGERWLPVHTPHTILLSVISMVSPPFLLPHSHLFYWENSGNDSYLLRMMNLPQILMRQDNGVRIIQDIRNALFD